LYKQHEKDIISKLKDDNVSSLEAVIWINMPDSHSYGDNLIYITNDFKTDGTRIWEDVRKYVEI